MVFNLTLATERLANRTGFEGTAPVGALPGALVGALVDALVGALVDALPGAPVGSGTEAFGLRLDFWFRACFGFRV